MFNLILIFGILALILGCKLVYETKGFRHVFTPKIAWEFNKHLDREDAEFQIQTLGHLEFTGLKMEMKLFAKFPKSIYKNVIELNSQINAENEESIKIIDRIHYSMLVRRLEEGNISLPLIPLDFVQLSSNEINLIENQLNNGIYLSYKVIGLDETTGCWNGYKNCTFIHNMGKNKPNVQKPDPQTGKMNYHEIFDLTLFGEAICEETTIEHPNIIHILRVNALPPRFSWYSYCITFSYWWSSSFQLEKSCFLYSVRVKDDGHRFVPKGLVASLLFCY